MKKEKEVESLNTNHSNSILQGILSKNKGDHYNSVPKVEWKCSTGSLTLDMATGGVTPSMWRLCGANNCGKTPQALEIIRNFLNTVPNSKAIWVIAEGRGLTEENRARCGLKFVENPDEWEVGTVFVLVSNIYELFIDTVKSLVKDNPNEHIYAFVVDSVDGLILRDDAAKDITDAAKVAGVPALSKKMMQNLSLGMFRYGHLMILLSQVTTQINLTPYTAPANRGGNFAGGNSLLHASDVIIEYHPSFPNDFILEDDSVKFTDEKVKVIGQNVRVSLNKTPKEAYKKLSVKYPIKYGRKPSGIWTEREIIDRMLIWGFVVRKGAWTYFNQNFITELTDNGIVVPDKFQGLAALYEFIESDKKFYEYVYEKFRKVLV